MPIKIKWYKSHTLFLDFDWCPIEVTITSIFIHTIWTSIGSFGWIAFQPHSSLTKCEAFRLRRGWVETNSFPSRPKLRIVPMAHRVTHPLSLRGHECSWVVLSIVPFGIQGKAFWKSRKYLELSLPKRGPPVLKTPSWSDKRALPEENLEGTTNSFAQRVVKRCGDFLLKNSDSHPLLNHSMPHPRNWSGCFERSQCWC